MMVHGLYSVSTAQHTTGMTYLDGDFDKVEVFDGTPDGGALIGGMDCGRAVSSEFMPTKMRWDEGRLPLPDFFSSRVVNMSERAKILLDNFEPGVHQFFPADCFNNVDGGFLERRYILNVCNRIDCMDHDKTTFVLRHIVTTTGVDVSRWVSVYTLLHALGEAYRIPPHLPHDTQSKFVFSLAKIGTTHLWTDMHIGSGVFMSDSIADAIMKAGLTGIKLPNAAEAV